MNNSEANAFFSGLIYGVFLFCLLYPIIKYLLSLRRNPRRVADAPTNREFSSANQYILTLVVRTDITMVKSKMANHCSNASVTAYKNLLSFDPQAARFWLYSGQTKILVAADSVDVINSTDDLARRLALKTTFVCDDRVSLIGPPTCTVLGIGPAPQALMDRITHDLRIL